MASRLSARLLVRHARAQTCRRNFSSSTSLYDAQNFTMPAMSPTMTEGNISSWKVKEGDSFSTGDVLLEIETDKASMDVEAQDDGIMAKIFAQDGSKGVKVGTRIAVIAEAGDDISSLKIPEDDAKPVSSAAENVKKAEEEQKTSGPAPKGTPENKRPDRDRAKTALSGPGQNPKYPLYPAVIALIHQNHIPEEEVLKIPATGPQNRLLKGDVLAYLGSIDSDYSKKQSERIEHMSHLDLSNIKVSPLDKPKPAVAAAEEAAAPSAPTETTISLPISLAEVLKVQKRIQETLGVSMPLSSFLARAVDYANDDLPLAKGSKPSADALFNAVLGLDTIPTASRGTYLPQIDALPVPSLSTASQPRLVVAKQPDILDILSGAAKPVRSAARLSAAKAMVGGSPRSTAAGAINVFSVTVPLGEEKRARTFLERMKTILQVEPGRLVL